DDSSSRGLADTQKYVLSRRRAEPLEWRNSTLLSTMEDVAALKGKLDKDIVALGSGPLVRALLQARLVDQPILLMHPVLLGSGRRLFPDGATRMNLTLTGTRTTGTGVIVATYR